MLGLDQEGQRVGRAVGLLLEGQPLHVDLDRELHAHLLERHLVEDEARDAQRHVRDLERRVEGVADDGVGVALRALRHLALERGVVASPGAHAQALRLRRPDLDLDLAELAVPAQVGRVVAEQVVRPRLARDAADPAREVVRVLDHEAAGVEGERLRAFGLPGEVGEHRHHVLGLDGAPEGGGEGVGQPLEPPGVDEVDRDVVAARGEGHVLDPLGLDVVDEALGDEDHRLAALDAGQRLDHALHDLQRDPVARGGEQVDLAGPHAHDLRDHAGGGGDARPPAARRRSSFC